MCERGRKKRDRSVLSSVQLIPSSSGSYHLALPVSVFASVEFHCPFQMYGQALTPQRAALDATPPACFPVGEGEEEGENTDEEEEEYKQWVKCV